jgi:hypothetical protein
VSPLIAFDVFVPNKDQTELVCKAFVHLHYKILERSGKKSLEPVTGAL